MMPRGTAGRAASVRAPRRDRGARHVAEAVAVADDITVAANAVVKDISAGSAAAVRSRVPESGTSVSTATLVLVPSLVRARGLSEEEPDSREEDILNVTSE